MNRTRMCFVVVVFLLRTGPANGFDAWKEAARYDLDYRVELPASLVNAGRVRLWVPTPANNVYQKVESLRIESPWPYRITTDGYGNRVAYFACDGSRGGANATPGAGAGGMVSGQDTGAELVLHFVVQRRPASARGVTQVEASGPSARRRFLGARIRIPIDGQIQVLAEKLARGKTGDEQRVRAFYDFVVHNMMYKKVGTGWGHGDALWACHSRYGNCTDFHSLFIGLARAQGIAARFVIGFPIAGQAEGTVAGYHCWAEAFARDVGWLPLDASEAYKSKRYKDYFGTLPSDRVAFTTGRDLVLNPAQQGPPLNFFVYPYAEVDGRPVGTVPWHLHYKRLEPKR